VTFAQSAKPSDDSAQSKSESVPATEAEVQQLRREVAELKAQIHQLLETSAQAQGGAAHLVQTNAVASSDVDASAVAATPAAVNTGASSDANASAPAATVADIDGLQKEIELLQKKSADVPAATAGWNGEHFFLKSSDGNFTLMPVGYLDAKYTFYKGDGAPSDTFAITRARFGVQGNYGKQLDYAFLFETASALTIRDAYVDFKPWSAFKIQGGQYKVPFSMEVGTADTNVEFADRSIVTVLYPDAAGAYRAPGVDVHGDLFDGRAQYWGGIFNGQGLLTAGTTNEPEVVGRVRFAPWRNSDGMLKGLSFGGSAEHSRSRGLSNEISFSVDDRDLVIVDDVLYTGRTIRAAMNGLFDLGRPKRIRLCVLIDRGHREMPIEATFIGNSVQTSDTEIVEVHLKEIDGDERVVLVDRVP